MCLFQLGEPAKEPVIVRVADQRVVEDVVLKIVLSRFVGAARAISFSAARGSLGVGIGFELWTVVQREFVHVTKNLA